MLNITALVTQTHTFLYQLLDRIDMSSLLCNSRIAVEVSSKLVKSRMLAEIGEEVEDFIGSNRCLV